MVINHNVETYRTSHTPLAACLLAKKYDLINLEQIDSSFYFIFRNNKSLLKSVREHDSGTVMVNAVAYNESFRLLLRKMREYKYEHPTTI